jgi:glycosyltransferase involved in cell wall biosynthesis
MHEKADFMDSSVGHAEDLVSVVVPAFNAEATIDETLASVRAQTHRLLDIIVVDDGSTDATAERARRHAGEDSRVRVISQENGGVASARNRGLQEAWGAYVAIIDSDDLWRPSKIARQLRAMQSRPGIGLVYTWSAIIDEHSQVQTLSGNLHHEGDVLAQLCFCNFIGNGSSPLMRRDHALEAGGFDPSLRARAAQGCEDWKLYVRLAERCDFAVVRDFLTGYRQTSGNMSSDGLQMLRSDRIVRDEIAERHPEYWLELQKGRAHYLEYVFLRSMAMGRYSTARAVWSELRSHGRRQALKPVALCGVHSLRALKKNLKKLIVGSKGNVWPFLPPAGEGAPVESRGGRPLVSTGPMSLA